VIERSGAVGSRARCQATATRAEISAASSERARAANWCKASTSMSLAVTLQVAVP
jgi:hypothetical protein